MSPRLVIGTPKGVPSRATLTLDSIRGLDLPAAAATRRDQDRLHTVLGRLGVAVADGDGAAALRAFQQRAGLPVTGAADDPTVARMRTELEHRWFTDSKTRTARIQEMLARVGAPIAPSELAARRFGPTTAAALAAFDPVAGMVDGAVVDRLRDADLAARLGSKRQVGKAQATLVRAARIAKLDAAMDPAERRARVLGPTSQAVISAFQGKYRLPVTGRLDPSTWAKVQAVAASQATPTRTVAARSAVTLSAVRQQLRLNMTGDAVVPLQQALAYFDYPIAVTEFKSRTFGATTRLAVMAFQKGHQLPPTGHVDRNTLRQLNSAVGAENPTAVEPDRPYRLRGTVRNEVWVGLPGITVRAFQRVLRGDGPLLSERPTTRGGFYDLPYDPPRDPATKQVLAGYQLQVRFIDAHGTELGSKIVVNPSKTAWVNLTQGDQPYRGRSEWDARIAALTPFLGGLALTAIQETDTEQDVTRLAVASGLAQDDVMRMALAARVADRLADLALGPSTCYAYLAQNLPPSLPDDLLANTQEWTLIDQIVDRAATGLAFMDAALQSGAWDEAVAANLVPIAVGRQQDAVLAALATRKRQLALDEPMLIGNASLRSLLTVSTVPPDRQDTVADAFVTHRGIGDDFWSDLDTRAADLGGAAVVADLKATLTLGQLTKNHLPTLTFLRQQIADAALPQVKSARDYAKLSVDDWSAVIAANGDAVPPGTDGDTPAEQVRSYATTLADQGERLFPTVAFAATVDRSGNSRLPSLADAVAFIDQHESLTLRADNVDGYVLANAPATDAGVVSDLRVLQRVHRLAPTADSGAALLTAGLHSSSQIVRLGKGGLVRTLAAAGVDERTALTVHGYAEFQYSQLLLRLTDFRSDMQLATPAAIASQTVSPEQAQQIVGDVPNLELLFGSIDYCDCADCQSIYSPAAYLADLLRFLESHPAREAGKTVRDVLFDRRPDIGNVQLSCANTEIPVLHIDLVCETLEAAIPAPGVDPDYSMQTTRSADELRALPENVRVAAYDVLRDADFPLTGSFDLWQEQTRSYLDHLGVPRSELMQEFRVTAPFDPGVGFEFFSIITHEAALITTPAATTPEQDAVWGFSTGSGDVAVATVLRHAGIDFPTLLRLGQVRWLSADTPQFGVERPEGTCDPEQMRLTQLTPTAYDRMHRFLRMSRHTTWQMWQLDLLIRSPGVGGGDLDASAISFMRGFSRLATRLRLPFEVLLALFDLINAEDRPDPADPDSTAPSLYTTLFRNRTVIDPPDPDFALPLAGTALLADHRPALRAALGITDDELTLLLQSTGATLLHLGELSDLFRPVTLARALGLPIADWLTFVDLLADDISEPYVSPLDLLEAISRFDELTGSGFTVAELDHLLRLRPDSPFGLRDDVIGQQVQAMRETVRSAPSADPSGQIASTIGRTFGLTDAEAVALLGALTVGGTTVLGHLSDPALMARTGDDYSTALSPAAFPAVYSSWRLLHKAATVITRLGVDADVLPWILANASGFGALALGAMPVDAAPATPLWLPWRRLVQWMATRRAYPEPDGTSLPAIFDLAAGAPAIDAVRAAVATLTGADPVDLAELDRGDQSRYRRPDVWDHLRIRTVQLNRLGISAATAVAWSDRDNGPAQSDIARQVQQTAKSKYDPASWLTIVTPLTDALRERKRDALVGWLVENSLRTAAPTVTVGGIAYRNPAYWTAPDDLLRYFLVDTQVSSCQLTSRIAQSIGAVQVFVQRCLLNVEPAYVQISNSERGDTASLDSWKQWQWLRSQPLWTAARQVFTRTENVLEPGLRDDKSPFFVDLENAILQNEINSDNCEAALEEYLHKVDEVSRLAIVGMHHELDDDNPYDSLPPNVNRVHVIGRTRTDPPRYFYRTYDLNFNVWSPWERIDLDITGDHVLPVVYNRKLHLFWLTFETKAQQIRKQPPAQPSTAPTDPPEPQRVLYIQLNWTVRKRNSWAASQKSTRKLVHPWERPVESYNLKPRYKARENQLWLDLYISTSQQFNNYKFYDPYTNTRAYVTAHRWDPTARPWHASSFVFDGTVVAMKLKPLNGFYHVLDPSGVASNTLSKVTSYAYVGSNFASDASNLLPLVGGYETGPRLALPAGMHYNVTRLANNTGSGQVNVLEGAATTTLLNSGSGPFEVAFSQHHIQFDTAGWEQGPLFYQDPTRAFFVKSEWQAVLQGYNQVTQQRFYRFLPFYHPYSALFLRELARSGFDGLLNRPIQQVPATYYPGSTFTFTGTYDPTARSIVDPTAEHETVDFSRAGAYSGYNWEIFFHAPLLIADKLVQNQRFDEAMRWYHRIFDPTNIGPGDAPQRYWITLPFFQQNSDDYRKQRIEELLSNVGAHADEVRAWKNQPYQPFVIARYRPVAFQKIVVMKYLDLLIGWGDQLFRQDTKEAIDQATLLYVLAGELLGERPAKVPAPRPDPKSYNELVADGALDIFGNQRVDVLMENFIPQPRLVPRTDPGAEPLPHIDVFYFGIPANDRLLGYWDTVADRLFKVRHCMNISGVVRQLPLFSPPIDPALLVKAAAAGVDIGSVLNSAGAPSSQYRFPIVVGRALELCAEVRVLGDKLLGVLERVDAEGLAELQSANAIELQLAVRSVRQQQIDEAQKQWDALSAGTDVLQKRIDYHDSIPRMNAWEIAGTVSHVVGLVSDIVGTVLGVVAGAAPLIPEFEAGAAGFGGSPTLTVKYGGKNVGESTRNFATMFSNIGAILHRTGEQLTVQGTFTRQDDANRFEVDLARAERVQLDAQIEAARLRYLIAQKDLDNHDTQTAELQAVDSYLKQKYTNAQLFDWMVKQLSTVYFQAYQLAFDMARRAEQCFQFELAAPSKSFVAFGYWDSLKKGLLAADRLTNDVRRMEAAYVEQNRRELEMTRHVSLARVAPLSLLALKINGQCGIELPEWLFDLDHPGHYRRRIKSVAISIPCVTGPYTSVNATLSLTNNGVRMTDDVAAGYGNPLAGADPRFARNQVLTDTIVTSHAVNDRGAFELRFTDDRYLPFEGAGAVSQWTLQVPRANNQFDLATISDVILHVDYTAIDGSLALRAAANAHLGEVLPTSGVRLFALDQEFGTEWYRFLRPDAGPEQVLAFTITPDRLPFAAQARMAAGGAVRLTGMDMLIDTGYNGGFDARLQWPGVAAPVDQLAAKDGGLAGWPHLVATPPGAPGAPQPLLGQWTVRLKKDTAADYTALVDGDIRHAYLVVRYALS